MTKFVNFCRRTEDPKLGYIERRLTEMGIAHRRNGHSFHAPILQVDERDLDDAWNMLDEPVDMGDGTTMLLDEIPDDHAMFGGEPDRSPLCCPFCGNDDVVTLDVQWKAQSLEPCDPDNSVVLHEHQCRACGRSFWS